MSGEFIARSFILVRVDRKLSVPTSTRSGIDGSEERPVVSLITRGKDSMVVRRLRLERPSDEGDLADAGFQ